MSEKCNHDCSSCSSSCNERTADSNRKSFLENPHELSNIKKVIGIVSGKGGVGKSLVTSLLTVLMQRKGYRTAILDADITGPSIPKVFGIYDKAITNESVLYPVESGSGTKIMSINLLLENDSDPVIWRGPIIAGAARQFWTDVVWGDVDFMFVDMPPGTGDVPLTVFQSIPVNGIIVVSSPQELVEMIVAKAVKMAVTLNIPIIGIVENMSYFQCPSCNDKHNILGVSNIEKFADKHGINTISKIPIDTRISSICDSGTIESFEGDWLDNMVREIEKI